MRRGELALKGSVIGILSQVVNLIVKFIVRTFTIRFLGKEILGLDSVLIDTITMLSLADLGITSAMLYRLYSPVIEKNNDRINELMAVYKRIYHYIAGVILVFGVGLSFFLPSIIKGISISWSTVYFAYYLQLVCSVSSYLFAYKRILFDADQKRHIVLIIDLIANITFSICKILVIIFFKSYLLYLFINIAQTIINNLYVHYVSLKYYSFLDSKTKIIKSDFRTLLHDTKDVMANKLASYVYSSTDNLIVSIILGTGIVGVLSNYKYIAKALSNMLNSAMTTILPLIGNYLNSDTSKEDSFLTLNRYTFVRFFLAGTTVIPFVVLADIFIIMWTGDSNYVMIPAITILLAIDYYISCLYGPLGEYILGFGLFKQGKYVTFAGAITNIILSIIGAKMWGCAGVLFATVVSQLVIWAGDIYIILFWYYREQRSFKWCYIKNQVIYGITMFICILLNAILVKYLTVGSLWVEFIIGAVASEVTFLLMIYFVFRKTDEYLYAKNVVMKIFNRGRI